MHSDHRSIGELAYHLWQARGCPEGGADLDWLEAERQLARTQRSSVSPAKGQAPLKSQSAEGVDGSLKDTFPASDPPAIGGPDLPPSNADEKWRAAGISRKSAPAGAAASKSRRAPADKRG
jgi:hypothetical protein